MNLVEKVVYLHPPLRKISQLGVVCHPVPPGILAMIYAAAI